MRILLIVMLPIIMFGHDWAPPQFVSIGLNSRFGLDCHDHLWCLFLYHCTLKGSSYYNSQWSESALIYSGVQAGGEGGFDVTTAQDGKLWVLTSCASAPVSPPHITLYYDGSVWSDTFVIPGDYNFHLAADSIGKVWAVFDVGFDYRFWYDVCEDTIWSGPYVVCSYPTHDQVIGSRITVDPKGIRWVGGTALTSPMSQIFLCYSDSTNAWSDSLIMGPQIPSGYGGLIDIISDHDSKIWIAWVEGPEYEMYVAYLDTNMQWSPYYQITQSSAGWCKMALDGENKIWVVYDKGSNFYYRIWDGVEWSPEEAIIAPPASAAFLGDVFYEPVSDRIWLCLNIEIADIPYIFTTWTNASTGATGSSRDGVMSEDFLIGCSDYPGYHWYPAVSHNGVNYLAVWQSNDDTLMSYYIHGTRISSDGAILDSQGIQVTPVDSLHINPAIAFDGTNYLSVYDQYVPPTSYWDVYGSKVTPDGGILNRFPITGSTGGLQRNPEMLFDGNQYFIVWQENRTYNWDIYGARVTPDDSTLDSIGIPISICPDSQYTPAVSFDGTNYLVVWQDFRNGNWDIYGARVTTDGVVIDDGGILINASSGSQTQPGIAFDGDNYLVVWRDKRLDSNGDVYGARVTPDGVVLEPGGFPVTTAAGKQSMPSVIFDDTDYFVTWEDSRDGYYGIYGAKVNTSGVVIDTFCISSREGEQLAPALAKGDDQILVAYSGWTGEPYKCQRIWGVFYPPVGIHEHETNFDIPGIRLLQIQPNPAAKDAIIKYIISQKAKISLSLYDNSGRLVKRIFDGERMVGNYTEKISLKNYPNGVYHLILKTSDKIVKKKVVLIK